MLHTFKRQTNKINQKYHGCYVSIILWYCIIVAVYTFKLESLFGDEEDIETEEDSASVGEDKDGIDSEGDGVQELDIETTDYAYGEVTPRHTGPAQDKSGATKAVLSPGPASFRAALKDVITGFSSTICE